MCASESCALGERQRKGGLLWSVVSLRHQGKSLRGRGHLLSEPRMNWKGYLRAQKSGSTFGSSRWASVAAKGTNVLNYTLGVESWISYYVQKPGRCYLQLSQKQMAGQS